MKIKCILFLAQCSTLASAFVNNQGNRLSKPFASSSRLFNTPEVLAEEGTWQAYLDEDTTGLIYYFDSATGESLWEPPTDTFPEVRLPRKKQRLAEELRREYRQSIEGEEDVDDSNWFTGFFEARQAEEQAAAAQIEEPPASPFVFGQKTEEKAEEPEGTSWFGGITGGLAKEEEKVEEPTSTPFFGGLGAQKKAWTENVEEPASKAWFGSMFGGDAGTKEEKQEEKKVEVKKAVEVKKTVEVKKEVKPVEVKKTVEVKKEEKPKPGTVFTPFAGGNAAEPATKEPVKKKDPKIGGGVPKPIRLSSKRPEIEITTEPIKIEMASNIMPHPAKVRWGGEDAVFTKGRSFGVFDGVSGAEKLDGVPLYSRVLAKEMTKRVGQDGLSVPEMTKFLTESADVADAFGTGASTAVVASIGENGFLQALNVGDSCCMVIRDGKITAKTREISHYWECPYQLSSDSPDRPKDGTKLNVELTPGDLIIMGSDGIFDNVDDDMILETVGKLPMKASQIAKQLCNVSRKQSLDKGAVTPYATQARRRGIPEYEYGVGGKVDDIGCVVVVCK